MLALSIIQPWTWAIAEGFKPLENRDWKSSNPGLRFRGRVLLHAGQKIDRDAYAFIQRLTGIAPPPPDEIGRGGIVGAATVVGITRADPSPWFFGPLALVLRDAEPLPFRRCKGQLGFFRPVFDDEPARPTPADLFGGAR